MAFGLSAAAVGLIGVAAGAAGSLVAANAAGDAADTQADASARAGALSSSQYEQTRTDQLAMYQQNRYDQVMQRNQTRADQDPYRAAGASAIARLQRESGANGDFNKTFKYADQAKINPFKRAAFEVDPGYQFRLDQGEQQINRAAASRGGAYSGATLKALSRFNSGLASQEYQNYDARQVTAQNLYNADRDFATNTYNKNRDFASNQFTSNRDFTRNNLATQAGIGQVANGVVSNSGQVSTSAIGQAGQNSANTIAQAGMNNAIQQGQAIQSAGEARASGYVGTANAIGSGIKQVYNNYQQNQALNNSNYNQFTNSNSGLGLSNADLQSAF